MVWPQRPNHGFARGLHVGLEARVT